MIDVSFWYHLEKLRKEGKFTHVFIQEYETNPYVGYALFMEWMMADPTEMGVMITECIQSFLHHHETLRKK